jgi:DNA-binding NtrC family response regulator
MSDTVTLPQSVRPVLAKKRPRLYVLFAPQRGIVRGHAESLPDGATFIGRRLPADREGITLTGDASVSEEHARFDTTDGDAQVTLRDLGSKNGSWVGATKLGKSGPAVVVRDGEVVRLGSTFLLLRYEPSKSADAAIPTLIGTSLAMRELRAKLQRLAGESAPVLLQGETGTGKELAAAALHALGRRSEKFVARNCGAFSESLIESELFGHAAHAFNDAKPRDGAFRSADRGTLFLDEIGELPLSQQAHLLRAVEEGKITPVGADKPLPCQARIVAATNRDLESAVSAGRFRQDLFARLSHLLVKLPPLRERREDILLLLEHFFPEVGRVLNADLLHALLNSDWRNNVRAVRAIADRLRIEGDSDDLHDSLRPRETPRIEVTAETHAASIQAGDIAPPARPYRLPVPSKSELIALLEKHLGTVANLAQELGCSRRQVQRYLEQHGLDADSFRRGGR